MSKDLNGQAGIAVEFEQTKKKYREDLVTSLLKIHELEHELKLTKLHCTDQRAVQVQLVEDQLRLAVGKRDDLDAAFNIQQLTQESLTQRMHESGNVVKVLQENPMFMACFESAGGDPIKAVKDFLALQDGLPLEMKKMNADLIVAIQMQHNLQELATKTLCEKREIMKALAVNPTFMSCFRRVNENEVSAVQEFLALLETASELREESRQLFSKSQEVLRPFSPEISFNPSNSPQKRSLDVSGFEMDPSTSLSKKVMPLASCCGMREGSPRIPLYDFHAPAMTLGKIDQEWLIIQEHEANKYLLGNPAVDLMLSRSQKMDIEDLDTSDPFQCYVWALSRLSCTLGFKIFKELSDVIIPDDAFDRIKAVMRYFNRFIGVGGDYVLARRYLEFVKTAIEWNYENRQNQDQVLIDVAFKPLYKKLGILLFPAIPEGIYKYLAACEDLANFPGYSMTEEAIRKLLKDKWRTEDQPSLALHTAFQAVRKSICNEIDKAHFTNQLEQIVSYEPGKKAIESLDNNEAQDVEMDSEEDNEVVATNEDVLYQILPSKKSVSTPEPFTMLLRNSRETVIKEEPIF